MSFAEQLKKKRGSLRPTETVVRPMPVCCTGTEELGLEYLGGAVEPERHEDEETTAKAAFLCAEELRRSEHAVVYTGAGVSTAAGIPDYRGPSGVWTSLATGRIPDETVDFTTLAPTFTHMCIAKLMQVGLLKFCTSTNLDCMHCKSGLITLQNLAELHGNVYRERCTECGEEAHRSFPIRRTATRLTGRSCQCGGGFGDSGIDFGQGLPIRHLTLAQNEAKKADFSLVLGTSLRVRPASDLPVLGFRVNDDLAGRGETARLCIVNSMDTPIDHRARIRSYGRADLFFHFLMRELDLKPDSPPECNLISATEMKRRAKLLLPISNGHFVGEEEMERRMQEALALAEANVLAA